MWYVSKENNDLSSTNNGNDGWEDIDKQDLEEIVNKFLFSELLEDGNNISNSIITVDYNNNYYGVAVDIVVGDYWEKMMQMNKLENL